MTSFHRTIAAIVISLASLLVGCTQPRTAPTSPVHQEVSSVLGSIDFSLETNQSHLAKATTTAVNMPNVVNNLKVSFRSSDRFTDSDSGEEILWYTFDIENVSETALDNLTFYAYAGPRSINGEDEWVGVDDIVVEGDYR
jgi:hypothetical protein